MLNQTDHTYLWKAFRVRPLKQSDCKFDTVEEFCVYDEPHNDYLYTEHWVTFIINLLLNHGFTKENIKTKCASVLRIEDYKN